MATERHRTSTSRRFIVSALMWATVPAVAVFSITPAEAQASPRSNQGGQITTAILISAASTQAAVERANAQTRSLYVELNRERTSRQAALRRAGISERERARLESELDTVNARQEELLAQLAAQDIEYAANIRAYRQGLTGLLEDGDPRIVAALQR